MTITQSSTQEYLFEIVFSVNKYRHRNMRCCSVKQLVSLRSVQQTSPPVSLVFVRMQPGSGYQSGQNIKYKAVSHACTYVMVCLRVGMCVSVIDGCMRRTLSQI